MNALQGLDADWTARLLLSLGHGLWIGMLVALGAALLCGVLLRRRSARLRCNVWLAALALMAAAPVLTYAWLGSEAPTQQTRTETRTTQTAWTAPAQPAEEAAAPAEAAAVPAETPAALQAAAPPVPAPAPRTPIEAATPLPSPTPEAMSAPAPVQQPFDWAALAPYVLLAYLAGVLTLLGRLALGLQGAGRLRRASRPFADAAVLEALARQASQWGMRAAPPVALAERVGVPTAVGVLRPMILLPAAYAARLTPAHLEMVLLHELAHIRRLDPLMNIAQRIVEALLFYNPAVWYASRQARLEREHACDDLVVGAGCDRDTYAKALVSVAQFGWRMRTGALGVAAVPKQSALNHRIERIMLGANHPALRIPRAGLALLLGLVCLSAAALYAATVGDDSAADAGSASEAAGSASVPASTADADTGSASVPASTGHADTGSASVPASMGDAAAGSASVPASTGDEQPPEQEPAPEDNDPLELQVSAEDGVYIFKGQRYEDPDALVGALMPFLQQQGAKLRIDRNQSAPVWDELPLFDALKAQRLPVVRSTVHGPNLVTAHIDRARPQDLQIREFIQQLNDEDWWLRKVAVAKLAEIPADEYPPDASGKQKLMLDKLKDEHPQVQAAAVRALGGIGDPDAVKHVVALLKTEDADLRQAAGEALARIDSPEVLDYLAFAIQDDYEPMQHGAAQALAIIGSDAALDLLVEQIVREPYSAIANHSAGLLATATPEERGVQRLIDLLNNEDGHVVNMALGALNHAELAPEQVQQLVAHSNPEVRAHALRRWATPRALLEGLSDPSEDVRNIATNMLGDNQIAQAAQALPAEESLPLLRKALIAAVDDQVLHKVSDVIDTGQPKTRDMVFELVQHEEPQVRINALLMLDKAQDAEEQAALVALLDDPSYRVQTFTAGLLRAQGWWPEGEKAQARFLVLAREYDTAASMGEAARPPLLEALTHPELSDIPKVAKALERIPDERNVGPLLEALEKTDDTVAMFTIIQALAATGSSEAVPVLDDYVMYPNANVQASAVEALGAIGTPEALAALEPALRQPREEAAVALLNNLQATSKEILTRHFSNPDVREVLGSALRQGLVRSDAARQASATFFSRYAANEEHPEAARYQAYQLAQELYQKVARQSGRPPQTVRPVRPSLSTRAEAPPPPNWEEEMRAWLAELEAKQAAEAAAAQEEE